ncbi:MAG: class I SAM-dependent methyltransferase [Aphanothece sp. CMT-3BRIN-NPC111]|jgi:SAM-dependent methyltransferase|nr:class I SAM-dependent methyltransferase [Aphanothece sp. CMT-3BRIN-NPC111]
MTCASHNLAEFIDLGMQPNGNNFPTPETKDTELLFPISMMVCQDCWQVQIAEFPSPEFLFTDHPYITGVNVPIVQHFERLASHIVQKLDLQPNSLVMDIGCNDGTLLKAFATHGMRTFGIDPSLRVGELARSQGITVGRTLWNLEAGTAMRQLGISPDLITATAVFYHLPDLHNFIEGLRQVMHNNTVFAVQCVNLKDLIERNQFDHFYHEHSCIHAIAPLQRLFEAHDMRLLDVEFTDIHGGSFILYTGLKSHPMPTSDKVQQAIEAEIQAGLNDLSTYQDFAARVKKNTDDLINLLTQIKQEGKRVFALGAPVKGNTLLNFCKIEPSLVECATEVNQFKIGRLTPGTYIPIIDERTLQEQPDYYLILSWNFLDYLIGKYKTFLLNGGKFIVPVPNVRVLSFESIS